ncbi:MAG: hypothetical protein ABSH01_12040 [Terriglobia bacterium]|jgi:hypothetical protein
MRRVSGEEPVAGHGQRSPDRAVFSCLILQRQAHVVNLDGVRCYQHTGRDRARLYTPALVTPPLLLLTRG